MTMTTAKDRLRPDPSEERGERIQPARVHRHHGHQAPERVAVAIGLVQRRLPSPPAPRRAVRPRPERARRRHRGGRGQGPQARIREFRQEERGRPLRILHSNDEPPIASILPSFACRGMEAPDGELPGLRDRRCHHLLHLHALPRRRAERALDGCER